MNKAKRTKLSNMEVHKLYGWMEENRNMAETMRSEPLAKAASKVLGFDINFRNINAAKKSMGLSRIREYSNGAAKPTASKAMLSQILEEVRALRNDLAPLTRPPNQSVN